MEQLKQRLEEVRQRFAEELQAVRDSEQCEKLRVAFLGKKGALTQVLKDMRTVPAADRPVIGRAANEVRDFLNEALEATRKRISQGEAEALLAAEGLDVTLPGQSSPVGAIHPIQQTIDIISRAFIGMGYSIAEGPEVECVKFNFDRLNIEVGHPSRDERDTFYVADDVCLRTQTSPVQVRVMDGQELPIRIICPGKVYRPDTPDATHSPVFHQVEGLVVDRGVAMSDLVGTLKAFAVELFGPDTEIRLRPHHFPFTEPSCEVDVTCWKCHGVGCPTCKQEGFVEILGAGMVHPKVLVDSGIDPEVYSGFAFGIGVERTAMARFNINDIRNLYENNLRFLTQFK